MSRAASTAVLGAVMVLVAATLDVEPLYVPGLAFLTMAGGALAWVLLGSQGLRATRTVGARTVVEDDPVAVTLRVTAGWVVLPTGVVEDPLLASPAPLPVGRRSSVLRINARFAARGPRVLPAPTVVVRDPFGLAERSVRVAEDAELLVLPRVHPVLTGDGEGDGDGDLLGGRSGRPAVVAETEMDGIRQLRLGTPASRIYWHGLARSDELMERRLVADTDTRPVVVLDPRTAQDREDVDAAVRATASLAVHLARAGGCGLLLPGDRRPLLLEPDLGAWPRTHVRLARLEPGPPPLLSGLAQRRGPVLYVTALRGREGLRPPRALLHAPGAGRVLVVPGTLPGRTATFVVAGCSGYAVGVRGDRRARAA